MKEQTMKSKREMSPSIHSVKINLEKHRYYLQVARLVSGLRSRAGLSQAMLAKRAGVSQPLIARLEGGDENRSPTFETVSNVLKALGYELEIKAVRTKRASV